MANSIDFTTLAIGAALGVGCRKQFRACGRVAANLASSLATSAAIAVNAAAAEMSGQHSAVGQAKESKDQGGKNNEN